MYKFIPALALVLGACGPAYVSEQGQLEFDGSGMRNPGDGTDPNAVLAGGLVCTGASDTLACFDETLTGAERVDDHCFEVGEGPTVEWAFTPRETCAIETPAPLVADRVQYDVVTPDRVVASAKPIEELGLDYVRIDGQDELPADWSWTPGEPVPVASSGHFAFDPELRLASDDTELVSVVVADVGYSLDDATATAWVETSDDGRPIVGGEVGDGGTVRMSAVDGSWAVQPFAVVDVATAASIEVVAVGLEDEDGLVSPLAARAIVRDANGDPIFGAPVVWTVEGSLQADVGVEAGLPGDDYAMLSEHTDAEQPSGFAVVTATLGDLSDTKQVYWDGSGDLSVDPLCGCSSGGSALGLLPVGAAIALLRRRRA